MSSGYSLKKKYTTTKISKVYKTINIELNNRLLMSIHLAKKTDAKAPDTAATVTWALVLRAFI
jgi:hypothetical protein